MLVEPRTAKGKATRERIVASAAALIGARGVAEMSLDDVLARARVSKGQLYHYFEDRDELLRAVVGFQADRVLAAQEPELGSLRSWRSIRAWFDRLVELQTAVGARGGCPLGSLVGQLAEADKGARNELAASFDRWEGRLRDGLTAMRATGKLRAGTDVAALATATMAAIQGGLTLTQARRDPQQLATALDAAYAHLRSHAPRRRTA